VLEVAVIAVLFPGQGSQTADMRSVVERVRPDLLELCERELGLDPFEHVGEGTHMAQPAIFCASLAGWSLLDPADAGVMAGHSLGDFSALVAAGAISETDGLRLVALRGRLMHEAKGGGMMAVGAPVEQAAEFAERFDLTVANDNSPEQVVLSGDEISIDAACNRAKVEGLRAARLRVSGAFHSPAMAAAAPELGAALARVELGEPRLPVYSSVTAAPFDDIRARLLQGLTSPVRWRETLLSLRGRGITRFVEVGPGRVLTGLVNKTLDGVEAMTLEAAVRV
jgi:acyl transferase domain-containing protein